MAGKVQAKPSTPLMLMSQKIAPRQLIPLQQTPVHAPSKLIGLFQTQSGALPDLKKLSRSPQQVFMPKMQPEYQKYLPDEKQRLLTKLQERIKPIEMTKTNEKTDTLVIFKRQVPQGIVNIKPALKKVIFVPT
jgi:hypothetical protein